MAEGKRPGGLTALAVLNFVGSGFAALTVIGGAALLGIGKMAQAASDAKIALPSTSILVLLLLLDTVTIGLLIASGVGYLKQKRGLGRSVGTAYAIVSLVSKVIALITIHNSFGIGNIIGLIYPVLTLILLNTAFKDDLVN
ncbi:MAG TPA: hypothetical protein VF469_08835 [Kofleriaceae bacterium]